MTSKPRRFSKADPCPVCGGHDTMGRGQSLRCFGYYDRLGKYARCTREEKAGGLPRNADGTFSHRLFGTCRCGQSHGKAAPNAGSARPVEPSVLRKRAEQRFRSFHTLSAFLKKRYGEGTTVRHWVYLHADGSEAFRVLRVDYPAPDGSRAKSYRPCHQLAGGKWHLSRPSLPLPLYRLPSLLAAPPDAVIALLEGEKCADLAASLGLSHVTTSAHGAKAPQLTDWSPLSGRRVALIGDADADGQGYVMKLTALLSALMPPACIHIVTLPGLADGEDIEQWLAHRRRAGHPDAAILAELQRLIDPPA